MACHGRPGPRGLVRAALRLRQALCWFHVLAWPGHMPSCSARQQCCRCQSEGEMDTEISGLGVKPDPWFERVGRTQSVEDLKSKTNFRGKGNPASTHLQTQRRHQLFPDFRPAAHPGHFRPAAPQ